MHAIIGDLHGNFRYLKKAIENNPEWTTVTIVGDVGLGFPGTFEVPFEAPIPVRFIRGNHDNPAFVKDLPPEWADANWHYIPDGTIEGGVLYIGGAFSIDQAYRTPGFDWWPEEELNMPEQYEVTRLLNETDEIIHTVVTHDAPWRLYPALGIVENNPGRTTAFLDWLFAHKLRDALKPTRWFFGHHHRLFDREMDGTTFRCLKEAVTGDVEELTIWE